MANPGTWLACQKPKCGFVFVLEQIGELPPCPKCGGRVWKTMEPNLPWVLSENDRRFLRSLRIQPGDEDVYR